MMPISEEDQNKTKITEDNLKNQWIGWLLETSKGLQPILKETTISATFILGDILIVWLAGIPYADIISKIPFLEYMYQGVKIFSVTIITLHYIGNCVIEINRSKKNVLSEILSKNKNKEIDTV